jgi:hypothetical protein
MHIIHIVEATEKQSLKIGVEYKIKHLVKPYTGIFHEFQFGRPKSTCISVIILKTISIDTINITNMTAVLHDIDASNAFDLVVNGIALLALRILGFPESLTMMIRKLWSGRGCHVKTSYGISEESYRSILTELLFGIGQGSTAATYIFSVLHGLVMHAAALVFVGIPLLSISGLLFHKRSGDGFIGDTGIGTMNPHSKAITSTIQNELTNEE